MTEEDAITELKIMVAASDDPALSNDEIDLLIEKVSLVDSYGYAPTHELWTGTYDLNRAASLGWKWKAAKVAGRFNFSDAGASYSRSQMYDHCIAMSKEYGRKVLTTLSMYGSLHTPYDNDWIINDAY